MKDSIGTFLIIAIMFLLTMLIVLTGCEKQEFIDIPERSEAYFRNSSSCDNDLCIYNNY
jgi:hypothetical protein